MYARLALIGTTGLRLGVYRRMACVVAPSANKITFSHALHSTKHAWVAPSCRANDKDKSTTSLDEEYTKFVQNKVSTLQAKVRQKYSLGQFKEALEAATKCKDVVERHYGTRNPVYASCLNNEALMNKRLGNYERARDLYEETVRTYSDSVGMVHPSTAVALHNLAHCIKLISALASGLERELLLEQAKTGFEDSISSHNKLIQQGISEYRGDLALSQSALGSVLLEMKDTEAAENMYQNAVNQFSNSVDSSKDELVHATVLSDTAYFYWQNKDSRKALMHFNSCWEIRSRLLPPDHPDNLATLANLATVFEELDESDMAQKIRETIAVNSSMHVKVK